MIMSKTQEFLSITLIITLFLACSGEKNKSDTENESNFKGSDTEVVLDEGKKWKVNDYTNVGVSILKKVTDQFDPAGEIEDYQRLSEDIEREFKLIFKNCTMEGEGHEQLHNYLYPIVKMYRGLREGDVQSREEFRLALLNHLGEYLLYFE